MSVCAIGQTPELISDDPRREITNDYDSMPFAEAYDAAHEKHGVLVPRTAVADCLGITSAGAADLIKRGSLTSIYVHRHVFIPLSEIEERIEMKRTGNFPGRGRPKGS